MRAHLVQMDLGLHLAHVEHLELAEPDVAVAALAALAAALLAEGVLRGEAVQIVRGRLAEVSGYDDAVLVVAADLVVVHLHALVDLAERDVDLAHEEILLVRGVSVEISNDLEGLRTHRQVLVDDELVRGLKQQLLDLGPSDRVDDVPLVELVDPVRNLHLQLPLVQAPPRVSSPFEAGEARQARKVEEVRVIVGKAEVELERQ